MFDFGADIDDNQRPDPFGVARRVGDGINTAHGQAGQQVGRDTTLGDKGGYIFSLGVAGIIPVGSPVRVAMTALVEGVDVVVGAHDRRKIVPRVGRLSPAVEQDEGRFAGRPPVEVMKVQAAQAERVIVVGC